MMDSKIAITYAAIFCVIWISYTVAEQQNSDSFLGSCASQQDICRKIGWEPKCSAQTINGNAFYSTDHIIVQNANDCKKKKQPKKHCFIMYF